MPHMLDSRRPSRSDAYAASLLAGSRIGAARRRWLSSLGTGVPGGEVFIPAFRTEAALSEDFNILVSSAGRRVGLVSLLRASLDQLGLRGTVLCTDAQPSLSAACQVADRSVRVPRCDDVEFIPRLLEICREAEVRLVVPTIDTELLPLALESERFEAIGTTVAISSQSTVRIGADKRLTNKWLVDVGLPAVQQTTVECAREDPGAWPTPFLVKPRFGSSSRGVVVVRDRAALDLVPTNEEFVVEKLAVGKEHTVDLLADRAGRCVCAIPRRRLEVRGGEVSKAVTVASAEAVRLATAACNSLPGAYGILNLQIFLDDAGTVTSIIELNARVGGGFPLSWEAGGRYPQWLIHEMVTGERLPSPCSWRAGLLMLRYDDAVYLGDGFDVDGQPA